MICRIHTSRRSPTSLLLLIVSLLILSPKPVYGQDIHSATAESTIGIYVYKNDFLEYGISCNESNLINSQLDVGMNYTFYVRMTGIRKITSIDYISFRMWYDSGVETISSLERLKENQRFHHNLTFDEKRGMIIKEMKSSMKLSLLRIAVDPRTGGLRELDYQVYFGWDVHRANGSQFNNKEPGHNNKYSWNFEIEIREKSGDIISVSDEFGIYGFILFNGSSVPQVRNY